MRLPVDFQLRLSSKLLISSCVSCRDIGVSLLLLPVVQRDRVLKPSFIPNLDTWLHVGESFGDSQTSGSIVSDPTRLCVPHSQAIGLFNVSSMWRASAMEVAMIIDILPGKAGSHGAIRVLVWLLG